MTLDETMAALKKMGTAQTLKTFVRHGAPADKMFGVKVGDMKTLVKKIKVDQDLALKLYATGNGDAQYFAGYIADDAAFSKKELQAWAETAAWQMVREYTVPWCAGGGPHGWAMGLKWIDAKKPELQVVGWNTLGTVIGITPDEDLDLNAIETLLARVAKTIHKQPGRVKYCMNGFVIAVGCFIGSLSKLALKTAADIGEVTVDMGETDCKVPSAADYIKKRAAMGKVGEKRKHAKC